MTCPVCTIKPDPKCPLCNAVSETITYHESVKAIKDKKEAGVEVDRIAVTFSDGTSVDMPVDRDPETPQTILSIVTKNNDDEDTSANLILGGMSSASIHITLVNLLGILSQNVGVPPAILGLKISMQADKLVGGGMFGDDEE